MREPATAQSVLSEWRASTATITSKDFVSAVLAPRGVADMIASEHGVTLIQIATCEREQPIERIGHLCDGALEPELQPLLTVVRKRLRSNADYASATCTGEPMRCAVDPSMECEALYQFVFDGRDLIAIIERDEWQLPESGAAIEGRVQRLLATRATCAR